MKNAMMTLVLLMSAGAAHAMPAAFKCADEQSLVQLKLVAHGDSFYLSGVRATPRGFLPLQFECRAVQRPVGAAIMQLAECALQGGTDSVSILKGEKISALYKGRTANGIVRPLSLGCERARL